MRTYTCLREIPHDCERYDDTFNVIQTLPRIALSGVDGIWIIIDPAGTSVENHDLIYINPCHIMTIASLPTSPPTNFTSIYKVSFLMESYTSSVIPDPPFTIGNDSQIPLGYTNGASFYDPKNGLLFHFEAGNNVWVLTGFVPICPNDFIY